MPDIENFTRIDESNGFGGSPIGFGGVTHDSAMTWLKEQGFTTVINLRLAQEEGVDVECSRVAAEAAGLKYMHLPFSGRELDRKVIDDFLAIAGESTNQPIYIHCRSATRVAALWAIGRVLKDGWALEDTRGEANAIAGKPDDAIAYATAYIKANEV